MNRAAEAQEPGARKPGPRSDAGPPVVAVTGGIASGKTTVSDRFQALGVPVVDTDLIAREVVAPGQPLLADIAERFGQTVIQADGSLDRRALRERIFADAAARKTLEALLHPAILAEARRRIAEQVSDYVIVVIPLLAEGGGHNWVDRVLVVDVPETVQLERLQQRDGVTRSDAEAALAAQASRQERLAIADDVIENCADLATLHRRVDRQHQRYLERYASRGRSGSGSGSSGSGSG
jgi:dephospho-CoA kinase